MQILISFYFYKHIGVAPEDGAKLSFQPTGSTHRHPEEGSVCAKYFTGRELEWMRLMTNDDSTTICVDLGLYAFANHLCGVRVREVLVARAEARWIKSRDTKTPTPRHITELASERLFPGLTAHTCMLPTRHKHDRSW